MLKLYIAPSYCSLIEALGNDVGERARGLEGKNYVFTEEKATLITERAIAKKAGGTFNTRVFSMRKFLKTLFQPEKLLSKEGSVMLLRKIIGQSEGGLALLGRSRKKSLAPAVYECIAQLKSAKVSVQELLTAAEESDGLLKDKLKDIAFLYAAYEEEIAGKYKDQNNYLEELPVLAKSAVSDADVYVAAYSSFTRQETEVLKSFMLHARSVTGYLVDGDNEFVYTSEAVRSFLRAAKEVGAETEIVRLGGETGAAKTVLENLFNPAAFVCDRKEADNIFLYEASSVTEELEHIASVIKRDVIAGKMRYFEAELALGSCSPSVVKKVFGEYEIPYFLDEKRTLKEHAAAKFALDFVTAFRRGYALGDMLALIKNPLAFPDTDFADGLENYILRYGYSRSMLFRPFRYGKEEKDFDAYEVARGKIAKAFALMKRRMRAEEFTAAIRAAFDIFEVRENAVKLAKAYEDAGYLQEAAFTEQGMGKLQEALDETDKILCGYVTDADEFCGILQSGFAADEISVLPQYADAVYVGNFRETRLVRAKTLFLAGLTSDIPSIKSDVAMLTDADLEKLETLKVYVEPKISAVNRRERENVALAAAAFSERLYLSCSVVGENGKPQLKSEIFAYFSAMFSWKGKPIEPLTAPLLKAYYAGASAENRAKLDAMRYLTPAQSQKAFARQINAFREGECDMTAASAYYRLTKGRERDAADAMLQSANSEIAVRLEQKDVVLKNGKLTASLLQAYYACPYRNFLSNVIGLKERKTGDAPTEIGNFFHAVFELFAPQAEKFATESEAEAFAAGLAQKLAEEEKYARLDESASGKNLLERMKGEATRYCVRIYRQYKNSDFKFFGQEVWFGRKGDKYKAIEIGAGGKKYYIEGKVDRIDKKDDYIRIVDYKTGSFSKADKDLFVGKDIQIYLYMNAFLKDHKPAGLYYCNVGEDFYGENDEKEEFFGHTLGEPEVIFAADKNLSLEHPESELTGIQVSVKKDGELKFGGGRLLSREQMDAYLKYALLIAKKGAERLDEGVIVASPYKDTCDYCAYKGMCAFFADGSKEERSEDTVRANTFAEAVKKAGGEEENGT